MNSYKEKLASSIINKPKQVILLALGIFLLSFIGLKDFTQNYSFRNWFNDNDQTLKVLDQFESDFSSVENLSLYFEFKQSAFHKHNIALITKISDKLYNSKYTSRVDALNTVQWIRSSEEEVLISDLFELDTSYEQDAIDNREEYVLDDPLLSKSIISRDKKATIINITLKKPLRKRIKPRFVLESYNEILEEFKNHSNIKAIEFIGNPVINNNFRKSAIGDVKFLLPILFLLIIVFIFYQFRSFLILFASLGTICVTIISMLGYGSLLSISFNNLTAITPQLILAIGLADAIHILASYTLYLANNSQNQALEKSLIKNFLPTVLTSITTAVGFISFFAADMKNITELGVMAAIGTLLAWFFTYFLLAPLLVMVKHKTRKIEIETKFDSQKYIQFLFKNKNFIYLAYFSFVLICLYSIKFVSINSDPIKYFANELNIAPTLHKVEKSLGGIYPVELSITNQGQSIKSSKFLNDVSDYIEWTLDNEKGFTHAYSIIDVLKRMNSVFNNSDADYRLPEQDNIIAELLFSYNLSVPEGKSINDRITFDDKKMRVTLYMKHLDSKAASEVFARIGTEAHKRNLEISFTGKRMLWQSLNQKVVYSFLKSLGFALLLVTIILCLVFRSLKIGILSIIPNIIPIVSGALFLVILSRNLDIGSSIVASIVLGIAIDDTIHVISQYLAFYKIESDSQKALVRLFNETAPALIITTLILSLSFSCFLLASFIPNQNMGILMSSSLLIALICDLTILPLMLSDILSKKDEQ